MALDEDEDAVALRTVYVEHQKTRPETHERLDRPLLKFEKQTKCCIDMVWLRLYFSTSEKEVEVDLFAECSM
jgi:hypothetical protein